MTAPPTRPATPWLDTESRDLVDAFWRAAGGPEPYPRALERALAYALPVTLVKIAPLHLRHAENWLRARGRDYSFNQPDRELHGCLLAQGGQGIIFVDGSDPADEMRFTIAHEIAHFLTESVGPRKQAIAMLGPRFAEVLDGLRGPSAAERFGIVMGGLRLGPCVDLLDRTLDGSDALAVWRCEESADRIALALLAPPDEVLDRAAGGTYEARSAAAAQALVNDYGLPPGPARRYADSLLAASGRGYSWIAALRGR